MKYIFNWTDNNRCYNRGYGEDHFFEKEYVFESDKEALKKVLEIQGSDIEDPEFIEDFNNADIEELKSWCWDIDVGFGSPVVFFAKKENGEMLFDSEMRAEEWKGDEEFDEKFDDEFDDE